MLIIMILMITMITVIIVIDINDDNYRNCYNVVIGYKNLNENPEEGKQRKRQGGECRVRVSLG